MYVQGINYFEPEEKAYEEKGMSIDDDGIYD